MRRAYHHNSNLMSDIASNASLDAAFAHVLKQRGANNAHYNDDIWALRRDWPQIRARLQAKLLAGNYLLSPVQTWDTDKGRLTKWCARDAVVLKAIADTLTPKIAEYISPNVIHIKGRGGLKVGISQCMAKQTCV